LSKAATKRQPLHRKHGNKNFYKGTGARSEGKLNSKAKFIVDKDKLLELVAPDLTDFKVCVEDHHEDHMLPNSAVQTTCIN
jgi:Mitochondrial ribosomal protein L27